MAPGLASLPRPAQRPEPSHPPSAELLPVRALAPVQALAPMQERLLAAAETQRWLTVSALERAHVSERQRADSGCRVSARGCAQAMPWAAA